jgi:hypothetical protein
MTSCAASAFANERYPKISASHENSEDAVSGVGGNCHDSCLWPQRMAQ